MGRSDQALLAAPPGVSDDVEYPGGCPPVVLEPRNVRSEGPWTSYTWPEPDLPPGTLVALPVPFPLEVGRRYLANGWQSWSAPTVRTLGHQDAPPPPRGLCRRHLLRLAGAGDASYDFFATADAVAGFTSGGGLLVADTETGVLYAIRRHACSPHPPVRVATGDGPALVDELLDRAGGLVPVRRPTGWSTWNAFSHRIDAGRVTTSLAGVRALAAEGLCDITFIDDGWQQAVGDWTCHRGKFPRGLVALAEQVCATGTEAGLWVAPLMASPHADVVARHPEWVARHPDGRPVIGATIEHWGGQTWVLDATRPAVLDHVSEATAVLAAAGFTTLKLDFLYAAADAADAATSRCTAGLRSATDLHGTDAVTAAVLDAIRAGAGRGVTLLGCGAPLWPSIGRVEWMRVGPDVTRYYRPHREPGAEPAMISSVLNGWRAAALRTPMHLRLWGNDPDSVPLSERRTDLTVEKRLGFARWTAASGQLLTMSDDFADLSPADLAEWRRLVSRSRSAPTAPVARGLAQVLCR